MKTIMIPIVTILLTTLSIQASTAEVNKEFTVTQVALDADTAKTKELQQVLIEVKEDNNTTKEGGDTE